MSKRVRVKVIVAGDDESAVKLCANALRVSRPPGLYLEGQHGTQHEKNASNPHTFEVVMDLDVAPHELQQTAGMVYRGPAANNAADD